MQGFIAIIWQNIDESRNYRDCYPVVLGYITLILGKGVSDV
jgi:hypothetical protein